MFSIFYVNFFFNVDYILQLFKKSIITFMAFSSFSVLLLLRQLRSVMKENHCFRTSAVGCPYSTTEKASRGKNHQSQSSKAIEALSGPIPTAPATPLVPSCIGFCGSFEAASCVERRNRLNGQELTLPNLPPRFCSSIGSTSVSCGLEMPMDEKQKC